jgi:hypothetical protein
MTIFTVVFQALDATSHCYSKRAREKEREREQNSAISGQQCPQTEPMVT